MLEIFPNYFGKILELFFVLVLPFFYVVNLESVVAQNTSNLYIIESSRKDLAEHEKEKEKLAQNSSIHQDYYKIKKDVSGNQKTGYSDCLEISGTLVNDLYAKKQNYIASVIQHKPNWAILKASNNLLSDFQEISIGQKNFDLINDYHFFFFYESSVRPPPFLINT